MTTHYLTPADFDKVIGFMLSRHSTELHWPAVKAYVRKNRWRVALAASERSDAFEDDAVIPMSVLVRTVVDVAVELSYFEQGVK